MQYLAIINYTPGGCVMKFLLAAVASVGLLGASVANAADMPVKAVEHHHVYDWTGFYVGGHIGYEWARVHDVRSDTGFVIDSKINSWAAGFHAGAQLQMGHNPWGGGWVLGVEAAHTMLGRPNNPSNFAPCVNPAFSCGLGGLGITTVGARFGASLDRWLFTISGGWATAYGDRQDFLIATQQLCTGAGCVSARHNGGYVGAAVENAFANGNFGALIVGLEYQHIWLNTASYTTPGSAGAFSHNTKVDADIIRARLTWKLNPYSFAVVAKY
jgi:opacity protein-like surface antigen